MAKNSDQHYLELLITLDYLLNHTDVYHPAKTIDICQYASDVYGLAYTPGTLSGNEIDRRRIGRLLSFLKAFSNKHEVPFVLEQTDGGKYYIEQKNYLNKETLLLLLQAVKNDKYTQSVDTDFLMDRLLSVFCTNEYNKQYFKDKLKSLSKNVRKFDSETNRKIRLVEKAYREQKTLPLSYPIYDVKKQVMVPNEIRFRVYKIQEYRNKPYAVIIPVSTNIDFFKGFEFKAIAELDIPKGTDRQLLMTDSDRDMDKLFSSGLKIIKRKYGSLENMIKASKVPVGGIPHKISFYFKEVFMKFVKPSFEEYFSMPLDYEACSSIEVVNEKLVNFTNDLYYIKPIKEDGKPNKYCAVNMIIDLSAFMSWLIANSRDDMYMTISDYIEVVGPSYINRSLYEFYSKHTKEFAKKIGPEYVERIENLPSMKKLAISVENGGDDKK